MTFVQTLLSPLRPAVATLLAPASTCSVYSLGCAVLIAFAWLAWRRMRRDRPVAPRTLARAILSRRVLLHRSTFADLAYCVIGLATLGAILGWAVVSTSWISDGVAALLTRGLGPAPRPPAPDFALDAARTILLFLAYELGFFVDHTLKHRVPALWELHKAHHSAEVLTPLVNFRVHPLDSLILANNLALFIGVIGGAAQYALGRKAVSFTLFDQNVLMLLYIYLTAQLQHSEIWIPFTGPWGRIFMSPAHHQLHHSANPAHFNCNLGASLGDLGLARGQLAHAFVRAAGPGLRRLGTEARPAWAHGSRRRPGRGRAESPAQPGRCERDGGALPSPCGWPRRPSRRRCQDLTPMSRRNPRAAKCRLRYTAL